ncbi:MAG: hypothetical protein COA62_03605 [Rhodobiaceae bacterium]|nr:MAG: hypothetical protein COA62_03605 [Rhodobiaceae bacterium]
MSIEIFDGIFRYGAMTLLLLICVFLLRSHRSIWPGRLGASAALCTAAYLGCTVAEQDWVILLLLPACIANSVFVWMFGLSLLKERFRPGWPHWGLMVLILTTGLWRKFFADADQMIPVVLEWAHQFIIMGMALHLLWVAWSGRANDLIEARRRFRLYFIAFTPVTMIAIAVIDLWLTPDVAPYFLMALQSFSIWVFAMVILLQAVQLVPEVLFFPAVVLEKNLPNVVSAVDQIAARDLATLNAWIEARDGFFETGLTIRNLGDTIGIPEHRLRRLINSEIGFRNFNDFLNHHRIEEAQKRLLDPTLARLPILTIAMDLGYGSIGPFNRAFLERAGQTPSRFRLQMPPGSS